MKELLLFQAGNIQFGLNLPLVKSIHGVNARFAEQAASSHQLVQVMDDEELPLYDLPSILADETPSADPTSQKVILVDAHEHPIALGVDRVEQVVSVSSDRIHPLPPIFNGLSLSCFPQILKHEDALILLLNPEEIENLEPKTSDTETDTPNPEAMKPSLEVNKTPGPITQVGSDIKGIFQRSSQTPETANGNPSPSIPYSESTLPGEIETDQSDFNDHLSETFGINADFAEKTISGFVKKAQITREEFFQKEPFQPEETIPSDEQEHIEPEPSALNASLEDMTPDTEVSDTHYTEKKTVVADADETAPEISKESFQPEESILTDKHENVEPERMALYASLEDMSPDTEVNDTHDTKEKTAAADVNKIAAKTSPDEDKVETGVEDDYFKAVSMNPAIKGYDGLPGETPSEEEKNEVDEESLLISSIGINLDPTDEFNLHLEEENSVAGDVLSQAAAGQAEEIISLKKAETAVGPQKPKSADPFRSVKEHKDMPPLPVGDTPYLFAAVSTESEPIPIDPAEEVSLKETETEVETLEEESTDPFRSVKEDKDMPSLPVGDVPYLFAAVSTESEPIPIEPAEEVSLKETETEVEIPESESPGHLGSAEGNTATLLMPVSEEPPLVDLTSIESEQTSKEPPHVILLDSSDMVTPSSGNRSEKVLTPTGLPQGLEIEHGKQKVSYRRPVAAGVLALVALLLLSMWLWPKMSFNIPEVVRKPIPIANTVGKVRKNPEKLLQTPQPFETENQGLSQTPQPSNTGEKSTDTAHTSLKAGREIFKIDTNDFTLTVERLKATEKIDRPSANIDKTGENEHSHIVMKNDTLWQIAKQYLDDPFRYPELAETSRISNPDRIYPGDVVRIIKKNKRRKGKEEKSL